MKESDMFYLKVYKKGNSLDVVDLLKGEDLDDLLDHKNSLEKTGLEGEIISEAEYVVLRAELGPKPQDQGQLFKYYTTSTSNTEEEGEDGDEEEIPYTKILVLNFFANIGKHPTIEELEKIREWLTKK